MHVLVSKTLPLVALWREVPLYKSKHNNNNNQRQDAYLPHVNISIRWVPKRQDRRTLLPSNLGLYQSGNVGLEGIRISPHLTTVNHLLGSLLLNTVTRLDEARVEVDMSVTGEGQGDDETVSVDGVGQLYGADAVVAWA